MIANVKKINFALIELTRREVVGLLLGETVEEEERRGEEGSIPTRFQVYCSEPASIQDIVNQLEHMKECHERRKEKEEDYRSFEGRC